MVNRNRGSGTRVLIDRLLDGRRPAGLRGRGPLAQRRRPRRSSQGRADWGLAIAPVAASYGLGFLPARVERYDFAIPESRWDRPAVRAFRALLDSPEILEALATRGFPRRREAS